MIKTILGRIRIPVILLLVILSLAAAALTIASAKKSSHEAAAANSCKAALNAEPVTAETAAVSASTEAATTSSVRTAATSTASVSTASETTTSVTTAAEDVCKPQRYVGTSPNSALYQENLFSAGDSITLGLRYFGFIPREHSIAGDSVSMWNLSHFSFTVGSEELGLVDAVEKLQPKMLYMWLGMNDVNLNMPQKFVKKYSEVIGEIRERVPDIIIIVAAITPVGSGCKVVKNTIIRDYNAALMEMVKRIDSPDVLFFDDYSVICDDELCLTGGYSSGDGMHLYIPCYTDILTALFDYLDTTDIKNKLEAR
ncbi:SGNH/GDSL hydrolase family protein [Ruminococcus sp.]